MERIDAIYLPLLHRSQRIPFYGILKYRQNLIIVIYCQDVDLTGPSGNDKAVKQPKLRERSLGLNDHYSAIVSGETRQTAEKIAG